MNRQSMLRRGMSESYLGLPSTPVSEKISDLRKSLSESIDHSPTSVLDHRFYAPSRQKRVTFAPEVFQRSKSVQRLDGVRLEDVDGISVPRAAFKWEPEDAIPKPCPRKGSERPRKPTHILEKRLEKVHMQLLEASFELEVGQNEVDELEAENEVLMLQLKRIDLEEMGFRKLQESVKEMSRKARKYSSKIAVLQKAVAFYNAESSNMIIKLHKQSDELESKTDS